VLLQLLLRLELIALCDGVAVYLHGAGIFGDGSECGKLHGKMEAEQKAAVLERFRR